MQSPPSICFLHIPKTGGASLTEALRGLYPRRHTISNNHFISEGLVKKNQRRLDRNVFIYGHPTDNVLNAIPDTVRIVTFLRAPRDQAVSYYMQISHDSSDSMHRAAVELGFQSFLRQNWAYCLAQTVTLSVALTSNTDAMFAELERRAWLVRNLLDRAFFVGTLERTTESYALLSEALCLETPLPQPRLNISGATREAIRELRAQYDELRDDPQTSYFLALEEETYRKAANLLERRSKEGSTIGAAPTPA